MMREYQVRICERLGVKFPGPTRQSAPSSFATGREGTVGLRQAVADVGGRPHHSDEAAKIHMADHGKK